jgi:deoxyribose-phosphate aldolase
MQRTAVALAQPEMLRNSQRNAGIPLRPEVFEAIQVNLSAVERRAATLPTRRSVKKEYQAAWLVKALTCIDLTTLAGDDTPARVQRLCAKAKRPLSDALLKGLDLEDDPPTVGAVCVYPTMSARAPAKSTSSSTARWSSTRNGRRFTTRWPPCARPAAMRI